MKGFSINGKYITGLLIDLDGVLYIGSQPIKGAVSYMRHLAEEQFPFRYITNTTRMSRTSLMNYMRRMSFPSEEEWIFSAPMAAQRYVAKLKPQSVFLITGGDVRRDFEDLPQADEYADVVLMGDPGSELNYGMLNKGFRFLMEGAQFVAMQRNRYWRTEEGLVMDAGAFVAALEYASGKAATVVGKPSSEFFALAVESLNLSKEQIAMIGDDIETDIVGARNFGLTAILVKTGKYRDAEVAASPVQPDLIIESFADLKDFET